MEAGLIAGAADNNTAEGDDGDSSIPGFKFALIEVGRSLKGSSEPVEKSQTGTVGPVLAFALIVCLGGVLGGYSHGFPSPTLLELEIAYQGGERVTAFSSSSIYEGIFGVSQLSAQQPAPPTTLLAVFIDSLSCRPLVQ